MSNLNAQDLGIKIVSAANAVKQAQATAAAVIQQEYDRLQGGTKTATVKVLFTTSNPELSFKDELPLSASGAFRTVGETNLPVDRSILGTIQEVHGNLYVYNRGDVITAEDSKSYEGSTINIYFTEAELEHINATRKSYLAEDETMKAILVTFDVTPLEGWSGKNLGFNAYGQVRATEAQALAFGQTTVAASTQEVRTATAINRADASARSYQKASTSGRRGRPVVGRPQMTVAAPQQVTETV